MTECRSCGHALSEVFADLGMLPLPNVYLRPDELNKERLFPLIVYVCDRCFLVQVESVETTEGIFGHYSYFSSFSETCLAAARQYSTLVRQRFRLCEHSQVIEAGSNDGYLLQYFRDAGIPVLGVEPAANIAAVAREKGIETWSKPFGIRTANELVANGRRADLFIANNVLAHVPDIHDFVEGLHIALAPGGMITVEFPHVMQLMEATLFDTIYHEHCSYLSLLAVEKILAAHELEVVDLEELTTHGGSLRLFVAERGTAQATEAVSSARQKEQEFGLSRIETYSAFALTMQERRDAIRDFVFSARAEGKRISGYGAPAKASTLLNYCELGPEVVEYTVDLSPHKQGRFVPGTRIMIESPQRLAETRPDYLLVFAWNLRDEITDQMRHIREWNGRFVIPLPRLEVIE